MSHHPARSFSHLAVCVSDLESSKRFYSEALGFIIDHDVSAGEPYGRLVELPNFKYSASFLRHEGAGVMLELLKIESPGHIGPSERRPINQLGITHLSFVIDDLDAVCGLIEKHGGRALRETRVDSDFGAIVFCTDPDGARIELWEKTA